MHSRFHLAYTISYAGEHYSVTDLGKVKLFFNYSVDGRTWQSALPNHSPFYIGGISEVVS